MWVVLLPPQGSTAELLERGAEVFTTCYGTSLQWNCDSMWSYQVKWKWWRSISTRPVFRIIFSFHDNPTFTGLRTNGEWRSNNRGWGGFDRQQLSCSFLFDKLFAPLDISILDKHTKLVSVFQHAFMGTQSEIFCSLKYVSSYQKLTSFTTTWLEGSFLLRFALVVFLKIEFLYFFFLPANWRLGSCGDLFLEKLNYFN